MHVLYACMQRKDVELTYASAFAHRKRFKQTHLCFIALICLVCSWLGWRSGPVLKHNAHKHTHVSENKTHMHKK